MEGSQANNHVNKGGEGESRKAPAFRAKTLERIMQGALLPDATIHPDATALVDQCVKEFIHQLAVWAEVQRVKEDKKKMSDLHVIKALDGLGYNDYVGPLTEHLRRYREAKGLGRGNKRASAQRPAATSQPSDSALGLLAAAATMATEDMAPQSSVFLLGAPPSYGVTVQGQAPAPAVTTATGEMEVMEPTPPVHHACSGTKHHWHATCL